MLGKNSGGMLTAMEDRCKDVWGRWSVGKRSCFVGSSSTLLLE